MAVTQTQVASLYVATFNRAPDADGLDYWVNLSGLTITQIAQSFFDQAETQALYPTSTTNAAFVTSIYTNLFARTPDAAGLAYWTAELTAGTMSRSVMIEAMKNGALGADAVIIANKTDVGLYYTGLGLQATDFSLASVTAFQSSVTAAKLSVDNVAAGLPLDAGQTFMLTAGVDMGAAFTGITGNDTFNAVDGTFSALDTIDGGAGTDTLNWVEALAIAGVPVAASVKNIENVNITSGATVIANVSGFTGLTSVNSTSNAGGVATNQITAAATTDVTVTASGLTDAGNGMVTVNGGKNVSVAVSGLVTIGADAPAEITVGATTAAAGTVTVTNATNAINNAVQADIAITGGTVVTVTESLGNTSGIITNTQGIVIVTGNASTTTVVVNQDAAAAAAVAVVGGNAAIAGKVNGAVTITDGNSTTAATDTITSVTLNSYAASTIDSTVLATLNLGGTGGTLGLNKATADTTGTATTLAMNITGGAVLGAISGTHANDITTLNVTTTGTTASSIANATFAGVTALNVSGTSKLTFTDNTFAALTTVVAGNGGLAMGTTALGNAVTFTGGNGDDSFVVGATTKALTLGTGNNTVTLANGTTAMGTGGSITAGSGTADTLSFATTANAVTLSTAGAVQTAFKAAVTGFERLTLAAAAGNVEVDVAGVLGTTNGSYVTTTGVVYNTLSLKNLVTSGTGATVIINNATGTNNAGVTLTGTSGAGISDIVNLNLNNTAADGHIVVFGTLTAANVETVKITVNDARVAGLALPIQAANTATIADAQIQSLYVSGNQSLSLTHTAGTALTTVNASGMTLGGLTFTSNASQYATTYTGSALGGDVVSFAAATAGVTGTETAGTNSLTGSATAANTLTGGTGADTLIGGVAADTISGGAGADIISTQATGTLSGAADQITLGNGSDTVILRGDVAASGAMTVAAAEAAAARITDFSISGATTGTDVLQLSNTIGNYNGAVGALVGGGAAAAGATGITSIATATGTAVATDNTTDMIMLTTGLAAGTSVQAMFNTAIGSNTVTGVANDQSIFVSMYDTTNSKMMILVDNVKSGAGANTIETGDTVTLVGTIDMTAAQYAAFTNVNFSIISA